MARPIPSSCPTIPCSCATRHRPTPIAAPGSLEDYFRGRNTEGLDLKTMFGELDPITEHPEYRDRAARVRQLDEQGLDGALLFPTLGVGMQEALKRDLPALHAAFSAFNSSMNARISSS